MSGAAAPLLELRGVSHRYGAIVALDDASFVLRPGTVHALLGENGAGKTTLMRVAFGLVHADVAAMRVGGEEVAVRSPADAIALGIGMVHQHFALIPAMTAAENVALGGQGAFDHETVARRLRALGDSSGMAIDPDARVDTLTVAEQQRLEIVKALHRDARVLILDEPTAVLAPRESDELLAWLRRYVAAGNAAVLITHKLREALAIADDITVLRRGRVVACMAGSAATVASLQHAMLGAGGDGIATDGIAAGERSRERDDAAVSTAPGATSAGVGAARAPTIVVRAEGVDASDGRERIRDVSFAIAEGEIVGVAGVEGAGHHLLMRLLAGRIAPTRGTIELPDAIGFIPEDRHRDAIIDEMGLAENVALRGAGARPGRMRWAEWAARAAVLVRDHDVRGADDAAPGATPASALSGGNQQKLVVARELAGDTRLVVAENPTRGLDVRAAAAVLESLRTAARRGAAVVFYSADLDEVLGLADRVLVVHAGEVTECSRDREQVGRLMLGAG